MATISLASRNIFELLSKPLVFVGEFAILFFEGIRRIFSKPFEGREIVGQMAFVGVASVPIVAITTFASGAVMALYISPLLREAGAANMAGGTVGLTITRELAPVIAAMMVTARCGSSMAAQIGSMAVTEQIDALRALAVHPYNYLVVPRFLASVLMMPILGLVGIYCGVVGGMLVATLYDIPMLSFLRSIEVMVTPWDFIGGLLKTIVFGAIISIVACQQGLRTKGGAVGVGRSTTNAVVIAMTLVYVVNYFLAALFF